MVWPVRSVSTSVPSLTSTSRLSAICMTIPSHVVVSIRQSAAEMYTKFLHKMTSRNLVAHAPTGVSRFYADKCIYCIELKQVERRSTVSARI